MDQQATARHRFELLLHGSLDRAVLAVDRSLRRANGIFEFCYDEDCILRIGVIPAESRILLPDGTEVLPEDPVVDLHFWNERLVELDRVRSSLGWGGAFRTRLRSSLRQLAGYVDSHAELNGVKACRAKGAFFRDRRLRRAAQHHGFVSAVPRESVACRVHEFLEIFLIYGLTWVFNPGALHGRTWLPQRCHLWMSRRELMRRYAQANWPSYRDGKIASETPALHVAVDPPRKS
jgi:YkoP domain